MRRNIRKVVFGLSVVCCGIACAVLGCASGPNGITRLLPSQSVLNGWRTSGGPEVYDEQSLYERINGGAEIFLEYGFERAVYQEYEKNDDSLQIEIYDMADDTAAFGIFSINKSPRAKNVPVGGAGQHHGGTVAFWQQDYYVVVRFFGSADAQDDATLDAARDIERKIGSDPGSVPESVSLLPTRGKVEGSDIVVRGRIALSQVYYLGEEEPFGLARGREAAIATYRIGDDSFTLLVVKYGTEDELGSAFERTANVFSDKFEPVERSNTHFTSRDKTGKYFLASTDGTLLTAVFGAQSADVTSSLSSSTG